MSGPDGRKIFAVVTGTRTDERAGVVSVALDGLKPDFCVLGEAAGVDTEAAGWCDANGVDYVVARALWKHAGKAAGPRRNVLMVEVCGLVAAPHKARRVCVAVPGANSVGTYHCAEYAESVGFEMLWV